MATVKVSENYNRAKSGKPPVGNFNAGRETAKSPVNQRHFPSSTGSAAPKTKHHVASKAVKTGLKATPQGRAASVATSRASVGKKATGSKLRSPGMKLPKSDKRTSSFIGKATDRSPVLVAEFVGGLAIIGIAMFTRSATEKYQDVLTSIVARYTAFTAVFFILFLMSTGSKRSSQAAAWFGLIIDLGLLFDATNHKMFEDLSAMINGTGIAKTTVLTSADKPTEFFATADIKDTQQQAGVAQSAAPAPSANAPASGATGTGTGTGSTKPIGNRGSAGGGTSQILDTPSGSLGS